MTKPWIQIGRYVLCDELARGGMATVHLGRLTGPAGFARTVAIKRLHPHLATDPSFVAMLLDEARLAGRIQHPNVAATMDVVAQDGELFVIMEYLHGETLARLLRAAGAHAKSVPPNIAVAIAIGALTGLHAAHEARDEAGEPLGLVHRDVSPQNIMVRRDGTAVVVDFGVAKAAGRFHVTEEGQIKGKLPYMASEQVRGQTLSRRVDIYAASAVLWETLVGQRLVTGANEAEVLEKLLFEAFPKPSSVVEGISPALDAVVMKGLERRAEQRWQTAREMALALEEALAPATPSRVAAWMEDLVGDVLIDREKRVAALESGRSSQVPAASAEDVLKRVVAQEATAPARAMMSAEREAAAARVTVPDKMGGDPPYPPVQPITMVEDSPSQPEGVQAISKISQVVSIDIVGSPSSETPPVGPPVPRRSRAALGALAAIPMVGIVAVVALTRGSPSAGEIKPVAPAADSASVAAALPEATASSTAVVSASVSASAAPEASALPSAQAAKPVAPAPRRAPEAKGAKAPAKSDCAVPYVIDATGRRIYKRECL